MVVVTNTITMIYFLIIINAFFMNIESIDSLIFSASNVYHQLSSHNFIVKDDYLKGTSAYFLYCFQFYLEKELILTLFFPEAMLRRMKPLAKFE